MAVKPYFWNILAASSWSVRVPILMTLVFIISPMTSSGFIMSKYLRATVPTKTFWFVTT